ENFQPRYAVKSLIMVYSQGNPDPQAFQISFQTNEAVLKLLNLQVVDTLLQAGGTDTRTAANNKELLLQAYEAGKAV
uniref:hypothetical protein n=1 Tax=Anaerospora hongkongensis TaxID=244830 RepID=UPI002FD8A704